MKIVLIILMFLVTVYGINAIQENTKRKDGILEKRASASGNISILFIIAAYDILNCILLIKGV